MRLVLSFLLVTCLLAGLSARPVTADLPGPNALGLYFDEEGLYRDLSAEAGESFELFLILTNPTMNAIQGWESAVILTNGNSVTTTEFPVGSQPLSTGPEDWAVSMTVPMPCNVLTKLAVFTVLAATGDHSPFYLGNVSQPSLAGDNPAVHLADGGWVALEVSSGDSALPVATINGSTPSEECSWGLVKSLYR